MPLVGDYASSTLTPGDFCLQTGVEMKLPINYDFLTDVFLILFQDVVSFQCSWEAGEKGKKILSNVQCLEQVSRTSVICLSCLLLMFCIVMGMLWILAVVQFSHLDSRD